MRKWWKVALLLLLALIGAAGLGRIRFETDPLAVLPDAMPEVSGLQAFQRVFSKKGELIVLLEADDEMAGMLPDRAAELGELLKDSGASDSVRWQPRWRDSPEGMAELFAWLWLNGEPEELETLAGRLSEKEIAGSMEDAMERVATALDGMDIVQSAHDPFGFLDHSALRSFFAASEGGGEGFESADGMAQLIFIDAPRPVAGYREADAWLSEVRAVIDPWADENGIRAAYTGDPAFEAEIGGAMEGDMRGTVGITSVVIGLLFLLMQRRIGLLAGLSVTLALVFVATLGIAGWVYGELSIMAAGFAAILIGLAVDYGVLICQEAKVCGHDQLPIYRATARSIGWAAATTAAVFLALNLSGLPGIAQLGTVVGIGVVLGALFMLGIYVPWVARVGAGRPAIGHKTAWVPGRVGSLALLGGLALAALVVLGIRGLPGVEFDRSLLRPRNSASMATFERIQEHFPDWGSPAIRLVVEGDTDQEVSRRIASLESSLEELASERPDLVEAFELPSLWWPEPGRMAANREQIEKLAESKDRLIAAADAAGFSEEGTALGRSVLEAMGSVGSLSDGRMPDGEASAEILRGVASRATDGGGYLLGTLELSDPDGLGVEDLKDLRRLGGEGIHLAGWSLLKPAVLPLVKKDLIDVFLPMAGLMLLMLTLVFRRVKDVTTAVLAMSLSGLLLLAAMRLAGIEWNFLNIAATPLLLGTGLDYAIHILLALRRTGGNVRAVWNGTGKAVLFCGCSTAIGFGSLAFASIDALASLGKVAVLGILCSMIVAVILVPGVRGTAER
ncbi:MMPL family transporter [Haloferula helveola]